MNDWKKEIPNYMTYFRVAVIPLLVIVFYFKGDFGYWSAFILFIAACITDFLDGYCARLWQAESNVGRFLDPIADKLLVATSLLLLVNADRADIIPAIAIVCREILVSGLREFLAEIQVSVPVSALAKWKTGVQMTAIALLLLGPAAPDLLVTLHAGQVLLWLAALLTLFTGYAYLKTGWEYMNK